MSDTAQKRALRNYRSRLRKRGIARFEVLRAAGKPSSDLDMIVADVAESAPGMRGLNPSGEADAAAFRSWRVHQLADC